MTMHGRTMGNGNVRKMENQYGGRAATTWSNGEENDEEVETGMKMRRIASAPLNK